MNHGNCELGSLKIVARSLKIRKVRKFALQNDLSPARLSIKECLGPKLWSTKANQLTCIAYTHA